MRNTFKYISLLFVSILSSLCYVSCVSDTEKKRGENNTEGQELKIQLNIDGEATRLGPIGSLINMNTPSGEDGLCDIGMYVYYTDDFNNGDLSKPYVRNMRCKIGTHVGGGVYYLDTEEPIYIYDEMTIELYYPYNAAMSQEENYFNTKVDRHNYYISNWNYAAQEFFPYYAIVTTYPNQAAHRVELSFAPKHVYRVDIVLVADNKEDLPYWNANIDENFKKSGIVKMLPEKDKFLDNIGDRGIDPETGIADGVRDLWFFGRNDYNNDGTGSAAHRYTAYFWTGRPDESDPNGVDWFTDSAIDKNTIQPGDVLLEFANGFTLIASNAIDAWGHQKGNETGSYAYRYGYNISTGEVFIPTYEILINDETSLKSINNSFKGRYYQICDIELSGDNWTPLSVMECVYDGGGHEISNLTITEMPKNEMGNGVGLFSSVFNSSICNVDLVNPKIHLEDISKASIGPICGNVNRDISLNEAMRFFNFPEGVPDVVIEALLKEAFTKLIRSTSYVNSSRVVNPDISVKSKFEEEGSGENKKKVQNISVGGLVGRVGAYNETGRNFFNGRVVNSYVHGGNIVVENIIDDNENVHVGGFVGNNVATIENSYTTMKMEDISAVYNYTYWIENPDFDSLLPENDATNPKYLNESVVRNKARSFGNKGTNKDCFAMADNDNADDYKIDGELLDKKEPDKSKQPKFDVDKKKEGITSFSDGWPSWTVSGGSRWPYLSLDPGWYSMGDQTRDIYPILQWERK